MGLGLIITALDGASLGNSSEVTTKLAKSFPGFKPALEQNRGATPWATAFLRSVLPPGLKPEFSGPTTSKMNVAHVTEADYVIEFQYDEGPSVSALHLTLYGDTVAAGKRLATLCKSNRWKMKYQ